MIVGHTPQEAGINSAAGGKLWRTDTGMTAMIGGQPEARKEKDRRAFLVFFFFVFFFRLFFCLFFVFFFVLFLSFLVFVFVVFFLSSFFCLYFF